MTQANPPSLIPLPLEYKAAPGAFTLTPATAIAIAPASAELAAIAEYLAARLRLVTGFALPVHVSAEPMQNNDITLSTLPDSSFDKAEYRLSVTAHSVNLQAVSPTGLFYAVQTLRQLLPPTVEANSLQNETWSIPACEVRDAPRFAWRGFMLDVARHFFPPADIKRCIDLLALYKCNYLHLHLTDDQGWRIMIESWPKLAEVGGLSAVGGGAGGFYSQAEYADLVEYARKQYITLVPEIETPGHINAALVGYPELSINDAAPGLYTGTQVGFSSLAVGKEITYKFLEDVIGELAALTPGPFFHFGGDEADSTVKADYLVFVERIQQICQKHGKRAIGWNEIVQADLLPGTVVQFWRPGEMEKAVQAGVQFILSPAWYTYLDMKYDESTRLGLNWAGFLEIRNVYDWNPGSQIPGLSEESILGVEAPLWTETVSTLKDIEYMAFPRLPALAEVGWSAQMLRDWENFRLRLADQGARMQMLGINFYQSPQIPWKTAAG